ncbi:hypothetical protein KAW55_02075 [bacterium]|nr:hypothetical protein [bacterium]
MLIPQFSDRRRLRIFIYCIENYMRIKVREDFPDMKFSMTELKDKLRSAVIKNQAEGLLLSGGLDSSILASLRPNIKAMVVTFESYGEDLNYARYVADFLNIEYFHKLISAEEAIGSIPTTIKALKSFDPAIPNDITVYFGLKLAKEKGLKTVMTGDGADELFAGYSFMQDMDNLDNYIQRISYLMHFSSNHLGRLLGVKIKQPYLDEEFTKFSLKIKSDLKLRRGTRKSAAFRAASEGKIWGKWILRKAFEGVLPHQIIWQDKRPLEFGSGTTKLREIISAKISDEEFERKNRLYPVKFMNKEHLYYYEIYKEEVGEIPKPEDDQKTCPGCGAGMGSGSFHCKVCGHVLEHSRV